MPLTRLSLRDKERWADEEEGMFWGPGIQCDLGRGESIMCADPFKPHREQFGSG